MTSGKHLIISLTSLGLLLSCQKNPTTEKGPTAEDIAIARNAISFDEISLMLRSGDSQTNIIAEVKRRHVSDVLSANFERELVDHGTRPQLIVALKDERNILTTNQKMAFDEVAQQRTRARSTTLAHPHLGVTEKEAGEQERQRLITLQQENFKNIEQRQREQKKREQEQASSRNKYQDVNRNATLYATPSHRRYFSPSPYSP